MTKPFKYFFELFFPRLCVVCKQQLNPTEETICLECLFNMPYTYYHLLQNNPLEVRLFDKVPIKNGAALFFYDKKSRYQQLIHQFKYNKQKCIGTFLGTIAAKQIAKEPRFEGIDYLIPVPLHPNKLKQRGYNQSDIIAEAMSQVLNIPVDNKSLYRRIENRSQTTKSSYERWDNSESIFELHSNELLENKNILIVDDVFTTGATMAACAETILKYHHANIFFYTLACV